MPAAASQYQSVFRIAKHDAISNGTQTRRHRQTVSCLGCRTRKLKCDRLHPCTGCAKRGDAASCTYTNITRTERNVPKRDGTSRDLEAQLRLQNLEEMVTSLMKTTKDNVENRSDEQSSPNGTFNGDSNRPSAQPPPQCSETCMGGHLSINDSETNYLGATHWEAILENIRDIQNVLEADTDSSKEPLPRAPPTDVAIVSGTAPTLTMRDICDSLPPRAVVDRILSVYFTGVQLPILHCEKFRREYESFWANPTSVSYLWISMLFSILHIGSQASDKKRQAANTANEPAKSSFYTRAGQALVAGRYDKARPYSVEAVLLYAYCNYRRKEDRDTETWMLMGLGVRLAMRMGYHRDSCHFPDISPFEGEMRRRTFAMIEGFDLLLSFQAGLPPNIHEDEYDTNLPSNLFDTDFDENTKILPVSRPPTDPTPMLLYCYKGRLAKMLRKVIRHALAFRPTSHRDTMDLDREIHEMHADVPPSLRMRALSSQFMDPAAVIWGRLNVDLMYLRCLCVLHRKYISHDRSNPTFNYSRRTCTDAALQILKYQADLHIACQPGGQFSDEGWMFSSLQLHDFLLAAMIVCLDLWESYNKPSDPWPQDKNAQAVEYDALKLSHDIWSSRKGGSRDARRASDVLAVMLSKVPRSNMASNGADHVRTTSTMPRPLMGEQNLVGSSINSPGGSSRTLSGLDNLSQGFPVGNGTAADPNTLNPLDMVFSTSDSIDWALIDQYLHDSNAVYDSTLDWDFSDGLGAPSTS